MGRPVDPTSAPNLQGNASGVYPNYTWTWTQPSPNATKADIASLARQILDHLGVTPEDLS